MKTDPYKRLLDAFGSEAAMAAHLGVSRQAVNVWFLRHRVPAERVLEIERLSGISRHELRPDVFGDRPTPIPEVGALAAEE